MAKKQASDRRTFPFEEGFPHNRVFGKCNCPCHKHPGSKHCVACCNKCPHCGENIMLALYDAHVELCAQNPKILCP